MAEITIEVAYRTPQGQELPKEAPAHLSQYVLSVMNSIMGEELSTLLQQPGDTPLEIEHDVTADFRPTSQDIIFTYSYSCGEWPDTFMDWILQNTEASRITAPVPTLELPVGHSYEVVVQATDHYNNSYNWKS